jgi:hypothetical protein
LPAGSEVGFVAGKKGGDVGRGERHRGIGARVEAILAVKHPLFDTR